MMIIELILEISKLIQKFIKLSEKGIKNKK
jgi:hypothetical protein